MSTIATAKLYNVYCDESGHVPLDRGSMVLGALSCPLEASRRLVETVRAIRDRHGVGSGQEIKWTKVSPAKVEYYADLIREFFRHDDWKFRAVVVPDKAKLNHAAFGQDADTWYYKMYYNLLRGVILAPDHFRIYLDIKDTKGGAKVRKLHEVLANSVGDFSQERIERVQLVHSHEVVPLQLTDLLIGLVRRANCGAASHDGAKGRLVSLVEELVRRPLTVSAPTRERKFDIFVWQCQERKAR